MLGPSSIAPSFGLWKMGLGGGGWIRWWELGLILLIGDNGASIQQYYKKLIFFFFGGQFLLKIKYYMGVEARKWGSGFDCV